METVSAYGPPRTSQHASNMTDQAVSEDGHSSIAPGDSSATPFVTKPRVEWASATSPADRDAEEIDQDTLEHGSITAAGVVLSQPGTSAGPRRSKPALEASRDSTTANLSDDCSEDVTTVQHPELAQSSAMVRGGEVTGSQDGKLHQLCVVICDGALRERFVCDLVYSLRCRSKGIWLHHTGE